MRGRDLTGYRFSRLTVIEKAEKSKWVCKCDCGNMVTVLGGNILSGRTKSCGCLFNERIHGKVDTRLHRIWTGMKTRCYNPKHHEYHNYGGRGIAVCDEWKSSFLSFYNWAVANGYDDALSIDRIDNNKGYSPGNCRWATPKEQQENRRCNHLITYNGKTLNITQWAEELGIKRVTLEARINRYHWDIEKAMTYTRGNGSYLHKKGSNSRFRVSVGKLQGETENGK